MTKFNAINQFLFIRDRNDMAAFMFTSLTIKNGHNTIMLKVSYMFLYMLWGIKVRLSSYGKEKLCTLAFRWYLCYFWLGR